MRRWALNLAVLAPLWSWFGSPMAQAQVAAPVTEMPDRALTDCQSVRVTEAVIKACSDVIAARPAAAAAYAVRGNAYRLQREHAKAIADFDRALELDPDQAFARSRRGIAHRSRGGDALAHIDFAVLIVSTPSTAAEHEARGTAHHQKGDYGRALADFNKAIELEPDFALGYASRASLHVARRDFDRAIADFDKTLEHAPTYANGFIGRGSAHIGKLDYSKAMADYDKAAALDPRNPVVYNFRGTAHARQRDFDRALLDHSKAVELAPDYAPYYVGRGNAFGGKADHASAIADFDKAIALEPKNVAAHVGRGSARAASGDPQGAIADFTAAIELDPRHTTAYSRRSAAYARLGDPERARADETKASELMRPPPVPPPSLPAAGIAIEKQAKADPDAIAQARKLVEAKQKAGDLRRRATVHFEAGNVLAKGDEYDKAIAEYTKAIEIDRSFAPAYFNRGVAYINKRDYPRAIADYGRVIELEPAHAPAYFNRGLAHVNHRGRELALADFNKVIELAPGHAKAYLARGQTYAIKKEHALALADYTKAIEIDARLAMAYSARAATYEARQEAGKAQADYRRALELDPSDAQARAGLKQLADTSSGKPPPLLKGQPLRVLVVRSAQPGCEPNCPEWISAEGNIEPDSPERFKAVLKEIGDRKLPVFVDSGGGAANAGFEIGRMIRTKGLDVFVSKTELVPCAEGDAACRRRSAKSPRLGVPRAQLSQCASACGFILAGGVKRHVGLLAFVGVHRGANYRRVPVRNDARAAAKGEKSAGPRATVVESTELTKSSEGAYKKIRDFYVEMGIDAGIMNALTGTAHEEMHWLTQEELRKFKIVTGDINAEQFIAAATTPSWTVAEQRALVAALRAVAAVAGPVEVTAITTGTAAKAAPKPPAETVEGDVKPKKSAATGSRPSQPGSEAASKPSAQSITAPGADRLCSNFETSCSSAQSYCLRNCGDRGLGTGCTTDCRNAASGCRESGVWRTKNCLKPNMVR